MLVNPEIYAWLNRQNRPKSVERTKAPLVNRGENTNGANSDKTSEVKLYDLEATDKNEQVEYLNERKSNFTCYT